MIQVKRMNLRESKILTIELTFLQSKCLTVVGVMTPFSSLDRTLADITVNIITTGWPWRTTTDPALKVWCILCKHAFAICNDF